MNVSDPVHSGAVDSRRNFDALFRPQSIAIVGASDNPQKLSGLPLHFLRKHGYDGKLYPINPRRDVVGDVPAFPNVGAVGAPIDLALILVPAASVLDAIDDCVEAGVKAAIVYGAGFAEAGRADLQDALRERIEGTSLRVVGPNCMGMVNLVERIAASFSQSLFVDQLLPGRLAFVTQSGAIAGSVMDMCSGRHIGLSHWISTGNEVDVGAVACGRYLLELPEVGVLAMYIEGLRDTEGYLQLVEAAQELEKRVVILKSGRSSVGAQAAVSHTGAIVGNVAVFEAVSASRGVLVAHDVEELLDYSAAMLSGRSARGPRVAVLSSSGAAGVMLADDAEPAELELPELKPATRERLQAVAPPHASLANPVDLTAGFLPDLLEGKTQLWRECALAIGEDPNVDQLVMAATMVTGEAGVVLARQIVEATRAISKPVTVAWFGGALCQDAISLLQREGVPTYPSSARTMRAAAAFAFCGRRREPVAGERGFSAELLAGIESVEDLRGTLSEWECQNLLDAAGVRRPKAGLATSGQEAAEIAAQLGCPTAMKIQSPDILHKARVGALRLGVAPGEAAEVYDELVAGVEKRVPRARLQGVLVQEMIPLDGVEVLAGIQRDPDFGPVMAVGFGGSLAEAIGEVVIWPLPYDEAWSRGRLDRSALARVLRAAAAPGVDPVEALLDALRGIALVFEAGGNRFHELEVNPLLVRADGEVYALDSLARLES
jgi:acyl-CoA synthetase (NDP forming)